MSDLYNDTGEKATMEEVVDWWLMHYEGLEHLTEYGTTSPETWYTINVILRRSFLKLKNRRSEEAR